MVRDAAAFVDFSGKTVIVTGGTAGIGEGCTRLFASAGANVVFCARRAQAGEQLKEELSKQYCEEKITFVQCDVELEDNIINVINTTIQKYGSLHSIINNAGYHPPEEKIDDISGKMFNELIHLNLTSIFLFCKYSLPHLRKTRGTIVNMSSWVGEAGQKYACRYVATKSGIIGLTKALAVDEGENGVRVNCVLPGSIETPLTEDYFSKMEDPERARQIIGACSQLGRLGTIEETGAVCLFLASDMSAFMTGCAISVSGGAELAFGLKQY